MSTHNPTQPNQTSVTHIVQTLKRILSYGGKSRWFLPLVLLAAVIGTLMQVLTPKILGQATTLIFTGQATGIDFSRLAQILLLVATLYLGATLMEVAQSCFMTILAQRTTQNLRNTFKRKMTHLPSDYLGQHASGNLMSIATNDLDNIASLLQQSMTQLLSNLILIIGILWLMLSISLKLTSLALLVVPLSLLIIKALTNKTQENTRRYMKEQGNLNGHIEESYTHHMVLKSFNQEANNLDHFADTNQAMIDSGWRAKFFGGMMMPLMFLLKNAL